MAEGIPSRAATELAQPEEVAALLAEGEGTPPADLQEQLRVLVEQDEEAQAAAAPPLQRLQQYAGSSITLHRVVQARLLESCGREGLTEQGWEE